MIAYDTPESTPPRRFTRTQLVLLGSVALIGVTFCTTQATRLFGASPPSIEAAAATPLLPLDRDDLDTVIPLLLQPSRDAESDRVGLALDQARTRNMAFDDQLQDALEVAGLLRPLREAHLSAEQLPTASMLLGFAFDRRLDAGQRTGALRHIATQFKDAAGRLLSVVVDRSDDDAVFSRAVNELRALPETRSDAAVFRRIYDLAVERHFESGLATALEGLIQCRDEAAPGLVLELLAGKHGTYPGVDFPLVATTLLERGLIADRAGFVRELQRIARSGPCIRGRIRACQALMHGAPEGGKFHEWVTLHAASSDPDVLRDVLLHLLAHATPRDGDILDLLEAKGVQHVGLLSPRIRARIARGG